MVPLTVGLAAGAGAVWYLYPQAGAWPLAVALLPWAVRPKRAVRLLRLPFTLPLFLFVGTAALSVWAAYDRQAALAKFWPITGGVLLFYAFADGLNQTNRPSLFGWLAAIFGGGVSLYFLATNPWDAFPAKYPALVHLGQALQRPLPVLNLHHLNPNVAGGILAVLASFAGAVCGDAWSRRAWRSLLPAGALLALILFGLLLTMARGAWLALAGAIALGGLWIISCRLARSAPKRPRLSFAALVAALTLFALVLVTLRPLLLTRLVEALPELEDVNRLQLYRDSAVLALDYPFIGGGLDGFMMLHASYVFLTHVGFSVHSHNLFLDVMIEQGLPGLFALLWLGSLFAITWWRAAADGRPPLFLSAAALALVTIALHGLVDDTLYGSRAVLLMFAPLAFAGMEGESVTAARPQPANRRLFRRVNALFAGGLALMVVATAVLPNLRSYWYSNVAAVQQSRMELSLYVWPEWPVQDLLRRELDLSAPVTNYERALILNPRNVSANRRLGQIELSLGEYEDALAHLSAGYEAMQWDNAVRQLYGEALVVNGQVTEGVQLWASVNNVQGQLATRTFWYTCIDDAERLAAVQAAAAAAIHRLPVSGTSRQDRVEIARRLLSA